MSHQGKNKVLLAIASKVARLEHANHVLPTHAHGMRLIIHAGTSQVRKIATEMSISKISFSEPTTALILLKFVKSMLKMVMSQKQLLDMKATTKSHPRETSPLDGKILTLRFQMTTSAQPQSHSKMIRTTLL